MWIIAAVLSSFFAGLTSVLAKCGIRKTDSDVATFLRTIVVVIFSFIMVFIVGSQDKIGSIGTKSLVFLILSGIATGASWICYFKALSIGDINKVVPVDKSSSVLSVILAIILFGETSSLFLRLAFTAAFALGIFLMIEKKKSEGNNSKPIWLIYALLSAIFASLTSILAKVGIENVESNLGTAIRTVVVLIMAFIILLIKGKQNLIFKVERNELLFIILSGIATGASWLFYYYAIQKGVVSVVVPIDKTSVLFTVTFSFVVFKEKLSKKSAAGLFLIVASAISMAIFL